MSASEELTIWMFRMARKAPSAAPTTATQVFRDTASSATAAGTTRRVGDVVNPMLVMMRRRQFGRDAPTGAALVSMDTFTDMPGRSRPSSGSLAEKVILTGI